MLGLVQIHKNATNVYTLIRMSGRVYVARWDGERVVVRVLRCG